MNADTSVKHSETAITTAPAVAVAHQIASSVHCDIGMDESAFAYSSHTDGASLIASKSETLSGALNTRYGKNPYADNTEIVQKDLSMADLLADHAPMCNATMHGTG